MTVGRVNVGGGGLKPSDLLDLVTIANQADLSNSVVNTNITGKLGSPTVAGDSWIKIGTDIDAQKANLAANLTLKGIASVATESLKALVDKFITQVNKVGSSLVMIGGTVDQPIPAGYYDGTLSSGKIKGDPNKISANIANGVTIDGITGTIKKFSGVGTTDATGKAIVTGLPFQPKLVQVIVNNWPQCMYIDAQYNAALSFPSQSTNGYTSSITANGFTCGTSGVPYANLPFVYNIYG